MPFFTSFLFCLLFTASAHAGFMYAFVSFPSLSLYLDATLEQPRTRREEGELRKTAEMIDRVGRGFMVHKVRYTPTTR